MGLESEDLDKTEKPLKVINLTIYYGPNNH